MDAEKQFIENGLVNWLYDLKKILVYKIYTPVAMSELIDLFTESLYLKYADDIKLFQFNDGEKSITVKLMNKNNVNYTNDIEYIIAENMMKFCTLHKSEIEHGLFGMSGFDAKNTFADVIENNMINLIRQVVTVHYYSIMNDPNCPGESGTMFTIRFY